MAIVMHQVESAVLGRPVRLNLITPEGDFGGEEPAVLYLLHGNGQDCTSWIRRSGIERYVAGKNLLVVLPEVGRSYYTNMADGPRWFTYLSEELEGICRRLADFSRDRRRTFVAGLSMGGYGALKWALRRPEMFGGAASLSGTTDIVGRLAAITPDRYKEFAAIFGPRLQVPEEDNLFSLAEKISPESCPRLYLACGDQDKFLRFNRDFAGRLARLGLPAQYHEAPGDHNWAFWDRWIQPAIRFLLEEEEQ